MQRRTDQILPATRGRLRGEAYLLLATLLWGTSFVIAKDAVRSISPGSIIFLRFGLALVLFVPALPRDRRLWVAGIRVGFWLWAGFIAQTIGLRYTTTGRSAFLTSMNVIFVPILAALHRRIGWEIWSAAAVALGGAWLLCYDGSPANVGDLWSIACAVLFAVFIIRLEDAAARFPALPLTAVQIATAAALSAGWFVHDRLGPQPSAIPWPHVVYLVVACTAITTCLQTLGQRDVPAPQASILFLMEPVFASVVAYLVLGDKPGWRGWLGSGLILLATLASQIPLLRQQRADRTT